MDFQSLLQQLQALLQQVLNFTGTFSWQLLLFLFLICSIGEFSFSVPYLLETVWLSSGFLLGTGQFNFFQIIIMWAVAQAARQTGATGLYYLSRLSSSPLIKLYNKYFESKVSQKLNEKTPSAPIRFIRKINYLSPFSVALGRMFWLRIPITLTLGIKRKHKVLAGGVFLQSLVWDAVYISLGLIVGVTVKVEPLQMVLYSLIGLTVLYTITFAIRQLPRLFKRLTAKSNNVRSQ